MRAAPAFGLSLSLQPNELPHRVAATVRGRTSAPGQARAERSMSPSLLKPSAGAMAFRVCPPL